MATLNNTNTYTRTMSGLSSVYSDDIEVNTLVVSGTATLPNGYMTLSGNAQTTTSQKTFSQPYQDFTLVNPFMRDFSNNGFAVPSGPSARITMRGIVGAYDTTYSNWRFVSGASATRTNFVQWWYGSGTTLEWTQQTIVGAPPTSNPSAFSGNYALAFTTNAPTQSFYTQMGVNLPAGYYTMTFYSYFGSSPYGGGFIGSTSAFVSISVENSTDTLNYADPETRANSAWKQRIFNFQVVGSNATYIRWTPNEIQSALYTFRWALAGISIRKNNGNFFTDGAGTTIVGGNYSFLENPVLNNPIAQNSLTCQGTPQFSLKTGASNLVLNSSFNTSNNNVNNVAVGWGLLSNSLMTNNTIVGSNSGGRSTSLNDCNIYGYRVSAMNNDTAIGSYIRCNDVSYNFNGWNTVIGSYIGIENSSTRQASTGVAWRCVAIGSEQYTSYNGFGKNPRSPSECISIGYRSQHKSWDNWNVSIGNYSLYNINGNNGEDDGLGYRHYTQYNVALGHEAGTFGNNYSYNTFIGARADASLNDCSFNTAIGYNAKANAFRYCSAIGSGVVNTVADSIRLGRPADTVYIDGNLNIHSGKITYENSTTTLNVNCYSVFNFEVILADTLRCNSILLYPNEISQLTGINTGQTIQSQLNSKANDTNVVHNSGDETINGIKTFNDGIILPSASIADTALSSNIPLINGTNNFSALNTFSNGLTLSAGTLTLPSASIADTALSSNIPLLNGTNTFTSTNTFQGEITATSGIRVGSTPYGFSEGIVFPTIDGYRKLVLYPVNNNPYENYSIGAHHTSNEMNFTVPDNTKSFNFGYATSSTTRSNILSFNSSSLTLSPNAYLKMGTASPYTPPTNSLSMGQNNSYRKIILQSVVDNEFQNYSIGTNTTNNEMVFMIPGITRTFKFCNASGATTKNDLFTLGKDFGASLSVALTLSAGLTASATQTINFGTNAPTMAGTNISGVAQIASANTFSSLNTFNAGLTVSNTILTANAGITASNGITVSSGNLTSNNLKTSGALDILSTGTGNVSMTATNGDVKLMGYGTNKGVRFMTNGTYSNVFFDNPPPYVGGGGLTFDANYQVFINTSIRASKEHITEIPDDHPIYNLETFMKIKPSLFYPKQGYGNTKKRCIGFIAEEINEIGLKELNMFQDEDLTKVSGVHYDYFSAYLVKAIQLQQKIIQKQQTQIDDLISILKSKNII